MTAMNAEAMTALQDLLGERQRYQGWLAALDSRRDSTPPHVYDRVRTDYALRMERVVQRLAERAGQLDATIASLTNRVAALRERESDKTDERHEAELRAAVGEFSEEEWANRREELDRDLQALGSERKSLDAELTELKRIVGMTREPIDGREEPQPNSMTDRRRPRERDEEPESLEKFVADWPEARAGAAPPAGPQGDGIPEVPEVDGIIGSATGGVVNPIGAAGADYGLANGIGRSTPAAGSPRAGEPAQQSAAPAPAADAEKTLRCPECGTMNYATEWYCERCGGELSTF